MPRSMLFEIGIRQTKRDGMPHVSMDYGFLEERDSEEQTSPVLVIRERRHKMTWAMPVPRKGTEFPWIAKRAAKIIDQLGRNRVTLRCDNGPAIEALAREIAQARQEGSRTVPERPPVDVRWGSLPARQERRKLRWNTAQEPESRPTQGYCAGWWNLLHISANRCDVGSDGKTPLQRLHGRRDNAPILEFGEKILYMLAKSARGGKWEPRSHSGVFVGMLNSSSEAVVVIEQGHGDQDTRSERQENS